MKQKTIITIGMKFGMLTVLEIERAGVLDKDKHKKCKCKCDCGNVKTVRSNNLIKGDVKSCGCLISKHKNILGKRFGRLTTIKDVGRASNGSALWLCKCDCGNEVIVRQCNLHSGNVQSCGCYMKDKIKISNTTHGLKNTRLYRIWHGMKGRCYNPNDKNFHLYGGKGICLFAEWKDNFISFYNWANNNGYDDKLTIDRIDSNGNYEPSNCQWITRTENTKRATSYYININGMKDSIRGWSKRLDISPAIIRNRYDELGEESFGKLVLECINAGNNLQLYKHKGFSNNKTIK